MSASLAASLTRSHSDHTRDTYRFSPSEFREEVGNRERLGEMSTGCGRPVSFSKLLVPPPFTRLRENVRARGAGKKKRKTRGWAGGREKGTGRRVALDDVERGGAAGRWRPSGLQWETEQEGNDGFAHGVAIRSKESVEKKTCTDTRCTWF